MGTWVDIKKDAATHIPKELLRAKAKGPVTIFMSSSTDPYQPIEHKEKITQSLLEIMVDNPRTSCLFKHVAHLSAGI